MEPNWMQRYAATELVELVDEGRMSRRDALGWLAKLLGGSAAAAAFLAACSGDGGSDSTDSVTKTTRPPVSDTDPATTPVTAGAPGHVLSVAADDPDVVARDVEFAGPASSIRGYLAVPASAGTAPGIVVIHEIFGLNDHIRDVARRLAKVGYLAIAPDLASRAGGTDVTDNVVGALTGGPVEDRVADLRAAAAFLAEQDGYDGHLGVTGFCFGGGMTLSFAAGEPSIEAAVAYYGPTPDPASVMSATEGAVLAHYGGEDARVNAGMPALEAAMADATLRTKVWPGVGHAFNNDTNPAAYDEGTAVAAWGQTLSWFAANLR